MKNIVAVVLKKELLDLFRDKKNANIKYINSNNSFTYNVFCYW